MRVLLLSRYARLGSSSRLRYYQFLPDLAAQGIEVEVAPLLPDAYLSALYGQGHRPLHMVIRAYLDRIAGLLRPGRFDLLWIEKELLPWLPYPVESLLLRWAPPYIVDYDDAWFHIYDTHRQPLVQALLGRKLDRIMQGAALVTVGNAYLAARALAAGARRIEILPTVVDLSRYRLETLAPERPLTVGWIGSPVTARYLELVSNPLARLCARGDTRLCLVGAPADVIASLPAERQAWSEDSEVDSIMGFDIGIMPLTNTLWDRGKCGYKLIQYMACGKPVIATPVGVNRDLVEHGVNGFLADTPEQWDWALRRLSEDADLRHAMGAAGRAKVEHGYTVDAVSRRLIGILRKAAGGTAA